MTVLSYAQRKALRASAALSNTQRTADILRSQAESLLDEVEALERSTPDSLVKIVSGDKEDQ